VDEDGGGEGEGCYWEEKWAEVGYHGGLKGGKKVIRLNGCFMCYRYPLRFFALVL
jgi:hypothetical protein